MIITSNYVDNFKTIEELRRGDVFKYEGEIYMIIDSNCEENVVNLKTGKTDEFNENEVVMLPAREPELKVDFA